VPSQGERNQLFIARAAEKGISLDGNDYKYLYVNSNAQLFINDFFLPIAGSRDSASAALTMMDFGYFWSSSPSLTDARFVNWNFGVRYVYTTNAAARAYGYAVRCFKNVLLVSSVSYSPVQGTWTTGSVTVEVTLNQAGATLAGWDLNGATFTKAFTGNWAGTVTFSDAIGAAVSTGISIQNIDKIAPTVTFGTNGNSTSAKSQSTTVTVSDTEAGVNTSSLKYQRTTNTSEPADGSFSTTFTNEQTITKSDGD
jgi:hypothetical protein